VQTKLEDLGVKIACGDLVSEYHSDGQLAALYADVEGNLLTKSENFTVQVIIMNLAQTI